MTIMQSPSLFGSATLFLLLLTLCTWKINATELRTAIDFSKAFFHGRKICNPESFKPKVDNLTLRISQILRVSLKIEMISC